MAGSAASLLLRPEAEHREESAIDGTKEGSRESSGAFREPVSIDKFQSERDSNGVRRQAGDSRREEHVSGKTGPVEIGREGNNVGLPDVDAQDVL